MLNHQVPLLHPTWLFLNKTSNEFQNSTIPYTKVPSILGKKKTPVMRQVVKTWYNKAAQTRFINNIFCTYSKISFPKNSKFLSLSTKRFFFVWVGWYRNEVWLNLKDQKQSSEILENPKLKYLIPTLWSPNPTQNPHTRKYCQVELVEGFMFSYLKCELFSQKK